MIELIFVRKLFWIWKISPALRPWQSIYDRHFSFSIPGKVRHGASTMLNAKRNNPTLKFLKTANKRVGQRGTTLIELSVVIAVLLLLVGVLFIGVNAWKTGSNTAACIINLSSIQKAARGYQNMNGLATAAPLPVTTLTGAGFWMTLPTCPTGVAYVFLTTVPVTGVAYATCPVSSHVPSPLQLANW
jgi:type II secretory pathway pseudopilin PulG